ncbi:MAG: oligoendopeptidase F [Verrucomicrobiota bacterium]
MKKHSQAKIKKVLLREQIAEIDQWDLSLIYAQNTHWEKDFEACRQQIPRFQQYRGKLSNSSESLLACLELGNALDLKMERLQHYASLQIAEDGANSDYLQRYARLQNLATLIDEASSFIHPEIQAIEDAAFENFLQSASLRPWKKYLQKLRRFKSYTLSASEERILALGKPTLEGYDEVFSQLTNVDMKFGVIGLKGKGRIELSHGVFSSLLENPSSSLRQKAFHQYYREFDEHKFTLAAALGNSVRCDVFYARARNYPSALEASLFPDAVPVKVYHNLIAAVRAWMPSLHRYYRLRRRILKLKKIHAYDLYVPLVSEIRRVTPFDQAVELILDALHPLGSEYVSILKKGLTDQRWCDRYETKGKRSGAFSSSSYDCYPYILMNYKEDVFGDVYTLAHEAGHSMHSWFSQKNQLFQDYRYPIFLAEVASTFNEELLTHHMLQTTRDPLMRAYILNRQIDEIRGTIFRQTMFAEFEMFAHAMEENGEALTLDAFRSLYRKLLNDYFGDTIVIDAELDLECLRIPHFYSAFYVYKYATGLSAAIALSQRVLSGGRAELKDFLYFLKSGGSRYPLETLQDVGVDMSSSKPIEAALRLFDQRISELEKILKNS